MKRKTRVLLFIAIVALISTSMITLVSAQDQQVCVSPALNIIANERSMARSAEEGEEIVFSATDFEQALHVSSISSLTVTQLPDVADGMLYLGNTQVSQGQVISRANLSYLKFVFTGESVRESSFCFSSNHGTYSIRCGLYSLSNTNVSPTVKNVDEQSLTAGTYRDIIVYGKMDAYDADGDHLVYEVMTYPQNGLLIQTDVASGQYRYIPADGFVGKDSFSYVVVDQYGNYSEPATVDITVTERRGDLVYEDLADSAVHVAAISLTEQGIMASYDLDGTYYFYPSAEITRGEFLVMAMKTLGIRVSSDGGKSIFADDEEITQDQRGYINVAEKLGYVCGKINEEGQLIFAPNEGITRAEAAVMIYNMTDLALPVVKTVFADQSDIPAWAKEAVQAMTYAGLMTHNQGYASPTAVVTKAECAQLLYLLDKMDA